MPRELRFPVIGGGPIGSGSGEEKAKRRGAEVAEGNAEIFPVSSDTWN